MMASATKEFVEKELDPHKERFEQKDYKLTEECMKKAGELGLLESVFQSNMEEWVCHLTHLYLFVIEFLAQMDLFSTAFGAHTGIGTLPILLYGNQQKERYLPKLSSGSG